MAKSISKFGKAASIWPVVAALFAALLLGDDVASAAGEPESYGRHQFDDSEREHWAFQAIVDPAVPAVSRPEWVRTPVDAFILSKLEQEAIEPAGPAEPGALLRRVYLDLIGLPPTLAEQEAFLADPSPEAYAELVDSLLARPEYGERWGRHWLDVVRYAESNGYERDGAKPHAWRYRDWVIDAFNRDMPFDRFVIEQIAGDELPESNAQTQIATTFLRLGPWDDEPADPLIDRYDQLDDVLGTTVTTFLGLTLRCARCHDHKFEPFTQRDYARVLAVFEPLKRPQNGRTDLDRLVGTAAELAQYEKAKGEADARVKELQTDVDALRETLRQQILASGNSRLPEDVLAAFRVTAEQRNDVQKKLAAEHLAKLDEEALAQAPGGTSAQLKSWLEEIERVNGARPAEPPRAYTWFEESGPPPATHVFARGNPAAPGDAVAPGLPAVLVDAPPSQPTATATTSGRRKQFAEWLVSRENPLTARVFVNRIWQHHFGEGLVGTENDFGVMGTTPTNAELLDYLASSLMNQGWSVKTLQRTIVLSNTYRLAAADTPSGLKADPDATLFWRWKPRRMEAETIRDAVLSASGQLNLARGGPSVLPEISQDVLAGQSIPGNGWKPSPADAVTRRSVYVFVKRTLPLPELEVMDWPSSESSCEQRQVSTVAPQALTYWNGDFLNTQAAHFATRVSREAGPLPAAQVHLAFRLALARSPRPDERQEILAFLKTQREQILADGTAAGKPLDADRATRLALESFCLVLLNSNEFVYVE